MPEARSRNASRPSSEKALLRNTVLRASGAHYFDVDAFCRRWKLRTALTYRVHEIGMLRRPNRQSGFNLGVSHVLDSRRHLAQIRRFLARHERMIKALPRAGAAATLDMGLGVGGASQFVAFAFLEPVLMATLVDLEVAFQISAYPCSDE